MCLIIFALSLRESKGPFFLNTHYDSGYVYLINSLNLSQCNECQSGFFDHPGAPLQVFGAVIIKVFFSLNGKENDISKDVLTNINSYINEINTSLILLSSFTLFIFGIFIYRLFKNIALTLFLQLTPFTSFNAFYELSDLSAENFLMSVVLIFILTVLYYHNYLNKGEFNHKKELFFLFCFALLTGLGIATKLNFITLMILPFFLLRKVSYKILYPILSFLFFLLFIYPVFGGFKAITSWFGKILQNSGPYSRSISTSNSLSELIFKIKEVFSEEIYFAIVYLTILICLIIQLMFIIKKPLLKESIKNFIRENKILLSVFLIMNVQFLFLMNLFSLHYMFCALLLGQTSLYFCMPIIKEKITDRIYNLKLSSIYLGVFVLIFTLQILNYTNFFSSFKNETIEAEKVVSYIKENYSNAVVISGYGSSNEYYALNYATYWAGNCSNIYKSLIAGFSPDMLIYESWNKQISSINNNDLDKLLRSGRKIIYQTSTPDSTNTLSDMLKNLHNYSNFQLVKKFANNNNESVYEIEFENRDK